MIGNWQWFLFLLVTVKCTWSLKQSEYGFYWGLLDDPYGNTFSTDSLMHRREFSLQMTQTHKFGLPKCTKEQNECRNIGIVGAGIAGLYCGILLAQAGHTVTIFEANNRAGGRIFTYRDPINPSLYMGELGAMRFPLAIQPYLNTLIQQRYKLNITQFINSNDNGYVYYNGIRATFREVRENPDIFKFNTSQDEQGKSSDTLWMNAMQPILKSLEQGGWLLARNQWDSYSADSYFNTINISQGARDYMVLTGSAETRSHLSILAHVRSKLLTSSGSKYYRIQGGNDHLIEAMISECQSIESNRCSIQYSTPITEIELYDSNQVQWKTKNATTNIFDRIIVATTPTAAQLINFNPRIQFIDKYRALRQVHLSCATKILLFFNNSWWYTQEHINGGQSITDLNIRSVYYPYTTNNETNGGTILAGYIVGYSSILWQSLSDSDAIELALNELIQLHKSSSNLRDYFQGGKVQNWCGDSYAHGATTWFTPLQETRLFSQLQASVSNVHFIGESTSLIQGWVEGSIVSALRGALQITTQEQKIFDVIIMGGNPVGLITAVFLSLKQPNLRIVIVEKGIVSITLHQQQFRQIYNQEYLIELANMSVVFWRQLEELANMSLGSILNTNDGFLFFGDMNSNRSTINNDLLSIKRTCDYLKIDCEYLNSTQIETRYSFVTLPNHYQGIFHKQSGYINVTTLMIALFRIINQNSNIIIREQEEMLSFKLFDNLTQIITDRGVLYAYRKVIFLPDTSLKNLSYLFNFNINVNLWELPIYYFRRFSTITSLPTWLAFDDHNQYSVFSGFSIDPTSDYIIIKPNFIENLSNSLIYPNQKTNIIDPFITQKVIEWVSRYMRRLVNVSDYYSLNQTYLSPFLPDNGYILDYIPGTNKRMLIQDSIMDMTFAPIWADILSDMTLFQINSSSKYVKYINYFSLPQSSKGYRLTYCLTVLYCLSMLYMTF